MFEVTATLFQPGQKPATQTEKWGGEPNRAQVRVMVGAAIGVAWARRGVLCEGVAADLFYVHAGEAPPAMYDLKENPEATAFYHSAEVSRSGGYASDVKIWGPALLFHRRVWF